MIDPTVIEDAPPPITARTLRQFSVLWLVIIGGLALWHGLVNGRVTFAIIAGAVAIIVGGGGLVSPRFIRPVFVGATAVTMPIGWIVSRLILAVLFYGVFTPLALAFRLIRRDALRLGRHSEVASYWQPLPTRIDVRRYFRQF